MKDIDHYTLKLITGQTHQTSMNQRVLNMLRRDSPFKAGLQIKRSYAAWNNENTGYSIDSI